MNYRERFDINFVTGEWRETPTEDIFADKTGWKLVNYSSEQTQQGQYHPANHAIDGKKDTLSVDFGINTHCCLYKRLFFSLTLQMKTKPKLT